MVNTCGTNLKQVFHTTQLIMWKEINVLAGPLHYSNRKAAPDLFIISGIYCVWGQEVHRHSVCVCVTLLLLNIFPLIFHWCESLLGVSLHNVLRLFSLTSSGCSAWCWSLRLVALAIPPQQPTGRSSMWSFVGCKESLLLFSFLFSSSSTHTHRCDAQVTTPFPSAARCCRCRRPGNGCVVTVFKLYPLMFTEPSYSALNGGKSRMQFIFMKLKRACFALWTPCPPPPLTGACSHRTSQLRAHIQPVSM